MNTIKIKNVIYHVAEEVIDLFHNISVERDDLRDDLTTAEEAVDVLMTGCKELKAEVNGLKAVIDVPLQKAVLHHIAVEKHLVGLKEKAEAEVNRMADKWRESDDRVVKLKRELFDTHLKNNPHFAKAEATVKRLNEEHEKEVTRLRKECLINETAFDKLQPGEQDPRD